MNEEDEETTEAEPEQDLDLSDLTPDELQEIIEELQGLNQKH